MSAGRSLGLAALLLAALAPGLAAQGDLCDVDPSVPTDVDVQGTVVYIRTPFLVRCRSGTELRGSSAVVQRATGDIEITGNVDYRDAQRTLAANRATYNTASGLLHATGNVVFTDVARGSTLRGPELDYYRPLPGRPEAQIVATQRPHLTIVPERETQGSREPLEVDADGITGSGQDRFTATGNVVIRRSDLDGSGARALYTASPERLELTGDARIRSDSTTLSGDRVEAELASGTVQRVVARGTARLAGSRFTLAGETIDAALPNSRIDQVDSRGKATLSEERLTVVGEQIRLFFRSDSLQRVVARGRSDGARPTSTATGFRMEGDSLDAELPGQVLDRVIAIGSARGVAFDTLPDGTPAVPLGAEAGSAPATDRDWIEGDTLIGFFGPKIAASPADSADTAPGEDVELRRALARGEARSLYRVRERNGERLDPPPLNYVAGETIELTFATGEIDEARVQGLRRGVYLDPAEPGAPARAPSPPPEGR